MKRCVLWTRMEGEQYRAMREANGTGKDVLNIR